VLRRPVDSAQYTSLAFGKRCKEAGVRPSMGSVGDAYDNAMCESFFATEDRGTNCHPAERVPYWYWRHS
jgi:transposase InsO family protein